MKASSPRTARSRPAAPWKRSPPAKGEARSRSCSARTKSFKANAIWHSNRDDGEAPRLHAASEARKNSRARARAQGRGSMPSFHSAAAVQEREPPAIGGGLGARDQARRLPHAAAGRGWRGRHAHAQGARLDGQVRRRSPRLRAAFPTASSTARSSRWTTTARRISRRCRRRFRKAARAISPTSSSTCCLQRARIFARCR